jgi:hypothetical protein
MADLNEERHIPLDTFASIALFGTGIVKGPIPIPESAFHQ